MSEAESRATGASASFRFVRHWKLDSPENDAAVLQFWEREGALGNPQKAKERVKELVLHARDADDCIAGVCSAVPTTLPRLGQPMYYYRCFIGKQWRSSRLVARMLTRAFETLEEDARTQGFPCIGVVLELENARFGAALRKPVWPAKSGAGFTHVGISERGLELRVRYFRGAQLKRLATRTEDAAR